MKTVYQTSIKLSTFFCLIILCSCAASYKAIRPERINYTGESLESDIEFSYKYNVLQESGNKKYSKREIKKGMQLIAVKVTNNGSTPISFAEDVSIYSNGNIVLPIEAKIVQSQLKQISPLYLLYGFLWVYFTKCENNDCNTKTFPIGIPIAIGNMVVASTANNNFLGELNNYNISNKVIQSGETAYHLIGLNETSYSPLEFRVRK